jgi:hypothetical protein
MMPYPNNAIIKKMKVIAFCIPKCANTSIKRAFMQTLSMKDGNPHAPKRFQTISKWTAAYKYDHFFKFAFVRNPYARIVSCYQNKIAGQKFHYPMLRFGFHANTSFREFVETVAKYPDFLSDQHFRSQAHELVITDDVKEPWVVPDFVGTVENIANDWPIVVKAVENISGRRLPPLPREKVTGAGDKWPEYYDHHLRALVQKRYAMDFEVFGYGT